MAQLNDLLVTGNSRFLNEINGKIDWSNILSKPTIPAAANNGTLTIQKNGTNVQTFTANQSTNVTANITVPTKVSELTNDSGYTTNTGTVTQVKVGTTAYNPTSGVISLPAYPSVLVTSVAGKTGAVTLTASDVGALASTTKYAGASTAGGAATSAAKLTNTSKVGDTNQPVYFTADGVPSAISYTIGKSVPSDAVFTDTKVTQTATDVSSNAEYEVLFSGTADDTTRTEGTRKTSLFTFNPQTNEVAAGHFAAKTDSPSGNKTANLLGYDIQLGGTSNTWDGTHTSLKDTITYLNSHFAPSAHDHNYLVSAGTNTQSTSSTAFATGAFNVRWFTETGKIPGQPSQYGFLLTTATGTNSGENHQIFMAQPNGDLFHRGTNGSSSSNPPAFKKILDSSNYTSYTRNSSGVIKVKSVNKTPTNAGTSLASPTPSIDTGYKFLCWLYVQSNGYIVGASYPGGATATNATWWFANGYLANYALTFYYLEIKDTI